MVDGMFVNFCPSVGFQFTPNTGRGRKGLLRKQLRAAKTYEVSEVHANSLRSDVL